MIESITMLRARLGLWTVAAVAAGALAAPSLACQNPSISGSPVAAQKAATPFTATSHELVIPAVFAAPATNGGHGTVVGMWHAILRIGDASGPVYDEVLEHFHADGTELLISNALPPALGNICIGVWKRVGPRTFKLKHMTWNWSPEEGGFGVPGTFAGHFELEITLRLDGRGNSYTGQWSAKNYGLEGEHLPALDLEGVVTGVRIGVD